MSRVLTLQQSVSKLFQVQILKQQRLLGKFSRHITFVQTHTYYQRQPFHSSCVQNASHLTDEPLYTASLAVNSFKSASQIQEETVMDQIVELWDPVVEIMDSDPQKALSICQKRLSNPSAYLANSIDTPMDELCTAGYYFLSTILRVLHLEANAPQPDSSKMVDVLYALRQAAKTAIRYPPPGRNMCNGEAPVILEDVENLVKLQRSQLQHRKDLALSICTKSAQEGFEKSVLDIVGPLQRLELRSARHRYTSHCEVLDEAITVMQEYVYLFGMKPSLERPHIEVLLSYALCLEYLDTNEHNASKILPYLHKCRDIMSEIRKRPDSDIVDNAPYAKIEEFYGSSVVKIAKWLYTFDHKSGIIDGSMIGVLLEEGCEIYRRLCRLPSNLDEGIPANFSVEFVEEYMDALQQRSRYFNYFVDAIDRLEHTFRILFLSEQTYIGHGVSFVASYADIVTEPQEIWSSFRPHILKEAILMLHKNIECRAGWYYMYVDETRLDLDESLPMVEKEVALALRLADHLITGATDSDSRVVAELQRAKCRVIEGKVKYCYGQSKFAEARAIWKETEEGLKRLGCTEETKEEKEWILRAINALLSSDIPDHVRMCITI